jgi:hypothetical protein
MKVIVLFFLLLCCIISHSQKNFEGWIHYKASPEKEFYTEGVRNKGDSMDIRIGFTKGKILIRSSKDSEEDLLILLDSAKFYTLDHKNKSYSSRKMNVTKPGKPATVLTIAGYQCTPSQSEGTGTGFGGPVRTTIWFADSLFFDVPENLAANDELLMIRNGHIMLKAEIITSFNRGLYRNDEEDTVAENKEEVLTIMATTVTPGNIRPEEFLIPSSYTKNLYVAMADSVAALDSTVMVDAVMAPPTPPVKKAPATPKKPAAKGKPATKPPIRKEN